MKRVGRIFSLLIVLAFVTPLQAQDRDLDNDGTWDYDAGGIDRDLDNDNVWDQDAGGIDRDMDNDDQWDE